MSLVLPMLLIAMGATPATPGIHPEALATINCRKPCRISKTGKPKKPLKVVHVTRFGKQDEELRCTPEEYWLIEGDNARPLLALCNNGYGASGIGEDTITVEGNLFTHAQYGGSAWRWERTSILELSPLRLLSQSEITFHALREQLQHQTEWNWNTFSGTSIATLPSCDESGEPDDTDYEGDDVHGVLIPKVALPQVFRERDWSKTSLGTCSADAAFTTFGVAGEKGDGALKVVASTFGELFIEVIDDTFVSNQTKWILGDHIELWLADSTGVPWESCVGSHTGSAVQYGIDVPSGVVHPAYGNPTSKLPVEVAKDGATIRVKVKLPHSYDAVTVVYSDSDDGKKQKRLIGTSELRFAQTPTLGSFYSIPESSAICELKDALLVPMSTRAFPTDEPALGDE